MLDKVEEDSTLQEKMSKVSFTMIMELKDKIF